MTFNWNEKELDQIIIKRNQGVNTTTEKVKYSDKGIRVIRANNISQNQIDYSDCVYVDPKTFSKIKSSCKPNKGDILYTNIGSQFGNAAQVNVDFDFAIAWNVLRIQPKKNIDTDFLVYLLNNPTNRSYIRSLNSSSTMPFVSGANIGAIKFLIPEFSVQRDIGKWLKLLDDKIKNNYLMNETLEEMVRTIFKSWFLDFDPVHAKASGKAPTHMDTKTASLFPNTFSDDGLPTGWSKLDVGSAVDVRKGLSYKGKFLSDSGSCMINLGCFGFRGTFKAEKIKHYSGDYKDRHKIKPGDLIFANTDMTQERAILCSPVIVPSYINKNEMIFTHHVSHVQVLRPQHPVFTEYLRQCMMTQNFRIRAEGYATGTTVLSVPKNIFDGYYVPIPSNQILDVFFEFISGISKKLEANYVENKTLSELRDTLLPKLMSGEIRVKDTEREVEAAV